MNKDTHICQFQWSSTIWVAIFYFLLSNFGFVSFSSVRLNTFGFCGFFFFNFCFSLSLICLCKLMLNTVECRLCWIELKKKNWQQLLPVVWCCYYWSGSANLLTIILFFLHFICFLCFSFRLVIFAQTEINRMIASNFQIQQ